MQTEPEPEVGDVGGLAIGMGASRLQVGALDQPHLYTGGGQGLDVALEAQQVGLHRGPKPVG